MIAGRRGAAAHPKSRTARSHHDEAVKLYRRGLGTGMNCFGAARIYTYCEERLVEAIKGRWPAEPLVLARTEAGTLGGIPL